MKKTLKFSLLLLGTLVWGMPPGFATKDLGDDHVFLPKPTQATVKKSSNGQLIVEKPVIIQNSDEGRFVRGQTTTILPSVPAK